MTTKIEAIRVLSAMQTATLAKSAALMGLRAEVVPGSVSIGLGAELRIDGGPDREKLTAELEDCITCARNLSEAIGHVLLELAKEPPIEPAADWTEGMRALHRRRDLFCRIERVDGAFAVVKYEWPVDPKAEPERVPLAELEDPPV